MIDFTKLSTVSKSKEIDPRDIFMSLPTKAKEYSYLRDVQSEVLKEWFENRNNKNTIIKMNTGSGKTVVALLILQSSLNEGKGPAVYVVPDSYLVKQVCNEANKLGILVTDDANDYVYTSKKAILVINIHKLVNGKSIFGMHENNQNKKIGSIVVDDVHACLDIIKQQYTVKFDSETKPYSDIIEILKDPIKKYDKEKYFELFENPRSYSDIIVPFWIWQEKYVDIKRILSKQENEIDSIIFNLPLIEDTFSTCNCVVSLESVEITPKLTQLDKISSFDLAKRRIFLSATLADDSVFISTLGLKHEEIKSVITPEKANDIGDRLMLFPEYLNPRIDKKQIKDKLVELAKKYNVVILTPSFRKAEYWSDSAQQILSTRNKNIEEGIDLLKTQHVGITIIINKYDGIDLPYEACRVLVIDDLPATLSLYDTAIQSMNPNNKVFVREKMQKIEQGIGRGVRSNTDYCVVVFLGKGLNNAIITNEGVEFFSKATKEQYKLSHDMWGMLYDHEKSVEVDEIFKLADYSLNRDIGWIKASKEALKDVKYNKDLKIDDVSIALREAFEYSIINEYEKAFCVLEAVKNKVEDKMTKGYIMQTMAEYKNFQNKLEAQEILKSGRRLNNNIIRPIEGLKHTKMINNNLQPINILDFLGRFNKNLNEYYLNTKSIMENLVFQKNTYRKFEEAVKDIFITIGFHSTRPENETGVGPDNLVALGNGSYLIIECKNESEANFVSKHDSDQMSGSIQWFQSEYRGDNYTYAPILIHRSYEFIKEASPAQNLRVMTPDLLDKFIDNINNFCIAWINSKNPYDLSMLSRTLHQFNLTDSEFLNTYTRTFKKSR